MWICVIFEDFKKEQGICMGSRMTGLRHAFSRLARPFVFPSRSPTLIASNDNMASTLRGINALNVVVEGLKSGCNQGWGFWRQIKLKTDGSSCQPSEGQVLQCPSPLLPYLYVQVHAFVRGTAESISICPTAAAFSLEQPVTVQG